MKGAQSEPNSTEMLWNDLKREFTQGIPQMSELKQFWKEVKKNFKKKHLPSIIKVRSRATKSICLKPLLSKQV